MTRKQRRLYLIGAAGLVLTAAVALTLVALEDSIIYFFSPSDLQAKPVAGNQRFRLGGLVAGGSVDRTVGDGVVRFDVTDGAHIVTVRYRGILPDLFREGQGVVTEGRLGADGVFQASDVLAKHDETYMSKEVADALKRTGQWRGDTGDTPATAAQ